MAVAKKNAVGHFEAVIDGVIERTPNVIEEVAARLPGDFPAFVSENIFAGMRRQAQRLKSRIAAGSEGSVD